MFLFFFFKQKTAYEMRISDWSSDVCSSDLPPKFLHFDTNFGTPGAGGPLVTAGGLVFIGYTLDDSLRAFDLKSGEVLWKTDLPAAGMAVPVTYAIGGTQYVVITAGGHSMYGSTMGDSVETGRASCRERVCQYV